MKVLSRWRFGLPMSMQLSILAACATACFVVSGSALRDDGKTHSSSWTDQCLAADPLSAALPSLPEPICLRDGPCYQGEGSEFCVFTTTTREGQGRSQVLPFVTTRERASSIVEALSDKTSNRNGDTTPSQPTYSVVPVPGKGLGAVSTREIGRGEHILSDSPALVVDHCVMGEVPQYHLARLMNEAANRLSTAQRDRILRLAVFGGDAPDVHYLVGRLYATSAYMLESEDGVFAEECGIGALFPEGT